MKLPEAKKKEAAADISEGWDDEEWEVSDRVLWWHKDSEALQFDHGVWLAFCQVSRTVLFLCMSDSCIYRYMQVSGLHNEAVFELNLY